MGDELGARALRGARLDAAHAGGDGAFRNNADESDVSRSTDMRAAAQFDRKSARPGCRGAPHRDDADFIAIFLAEQRAGASGDRLLLRHQARLDRRVALHDLIAKPLDLGQFFLGHRLGMGEIEPQAVRRDQGALLLNMVADHLAQRLVQNMRRRMIGARG